MENNKINESTNPQENNGMLVDFGPIEDLSQNIIKVIGVGGGGCNAVRSMCDEGIEGVTYAACNTDSAALSKLNVPVKIQLGEAGLGAGARPEVGRKAAESNLNDIKRLLDDGTKMVFVTAGMGGGTGTGAAPVVARAAKECGILTIGVVTIPFYFEQKRKIIKALKGVEELRKNVDAMLIVNNERLCDVYSNSQVTLKEAFKRADNVLKDAVKGISELITISSEGSINLDFCDVEATMRNGGGAIMATGRASGEHRVERAIINALDSPLLYGSDIGKAKRVLFNIYASEEAPLFVPELSEITEFFEQLDPEIEVIWGTAEDNSLGEDAKVIILASDMTDGLHQDKLEKQPDITDEEYYENLIQELYKQKKQTEEKTDVLLSDNEKNEGESPTLIIKFDEETVTDEKGKDNDFATDPNLHTPEEGTEVEEEEKRAPMVERWKKWLERKLTDVMNIDE